MWGITRHAYTLQHARVRKASEASDDNETESGPVTHDFNLLSAETKADADQDENGVRHVRGKGCFVSRVDSRILLVSGKPRHAGSSAVVTIYLAKRLERSACATLPYLAVGSFAVRFMADANSIWAANARRALILRWESVWRHRASRPNWGVVPDPRYMDRSGSREASSSG